MNAYRLQRQDPQPDDARSFSRNQTLVRIKGHGKIKNYVQYALKTLDIPSVSRIALEAEGEATVKAVTCAEIIKRKCPRPLHQYTTVDSVSQTETWDATQPSLDKLTVKRFVPKLNIVLSLTENPGLAATAGYQAPSLHS
ncbi:hypothetical protein H4R35_004201 [Dimargaris xerosporica]|nr:hypothetical protein H4R35_004201 [Dimargaris xerosporica]